MTPLLVWLSLIVQILDRKFIECIWADEENLSVKLTEKIKMLKEDCPKVIKNKADFDRHMECDFNFFDLKWSEHCDVEKSTLRIRHENFPMNITSRDIMSCPDELEIDLSSIPNSNLGVWTNVFIRKHTIFGPYEGIRVYNCTEDHSHGWNANVMNWREGEAVMAHDPNNSNWMRYVNSARSYAELNLKKFVDYKGDIYYIALEDIMQNAELLVNYPSSLPIPPQIFWAPAFKHNLTYNTFKCEFCLQTFDNPFTIKDHLHDKHFIPGDFERFTIICKPEKDIFGEMMVRGRTILDQVRKNETVKQHYKEPKWTAKERKHEANGELLAQHIRRRRHAQVTGMTNDTTIEKIMKEKKTRKPYKKRTTTDSSTIKQKLKAKHSKRLTTTKFAKTRKSNINNNHTTKRNPELLASHLSTFQFNQTNFINHNSSKPLVETTTEEVKRINLDFASMTNLEEKIRKKLIEAGIDINAEKHKNVTVGTKHPLEDVYEYGMKSDDDGGMQPGEFADFVEKLRVLKEFGTLNVSTDQNQEAHKNHNWPTSPENMKTNVTPMVQTTSTTSTLITHTFSNAVTYGYTEKQSSQKRKYSKHNKECTCPTYSDYRLISHVFTPVSDSDFGVEDEYIRVEPRYSYSNSNETDVNVTLSYTTISKNITKGRNTRFDRFKYMFTTAKIKKKKKTLVGKSTLKARGRPRKNQTGAVTTKTKRTKKFKSNLTKT